MPIYVYGCKKCGTVEEHIQRFSDPPLTKCEHCGGRLEKQLTAAAFHLKGGGWYKDGYASPKADAGGGSEGGGSEGGSSDSGGSDSGSSDSGSSGSSSDSSSSSDSKPAKAKPAKKAAKKKKSSAASK